MDGVAQTTSGYTTLHTTNTAYLDIGHSVGDPTHDFNMGGLDEGRMSNIVRSADWIKTEYNNQSSPSTFYSYGALGASVRQNSSGVSAPAIKVRGGVRFR